MASNAAQSARRAYRELLLYASNDIQRKEVRSAFRKALGQDETIDSRLKKAEERLSFLRITSVKPKRMKAEARNSGKWVYKNGERIENVAGTWRNDKGYVVSPYDGKNLDPESVSYHRKNLKRAGFVNNLHAKGIF